MTGTLAGKVGDLPRNWNSGSKALRVLTKKPWMIAMANFLYAKIYHTLGSASLGSTFTKYSEWENKRCMYFNGLSCWSQEHSSQWSCQIEVENQIQKMHRLLPSALMSSPWVKVGLNQIQKSWKRVRLGLYNKSSSRSTPIHSDSTPRFHWS